MRKLFSLKALALASLIAYDSLFLTACGGVIAQAAADKENIITADSNARIAATSAAVMTICEKLDLDLVAVPTSSLVEIPDRYSDAASLGSPMSPDMEILDSCEPDWVLSPLSLYADLQPKYEAAGYNYAFLNLKSVEGMYDSIEDLGELFDRRAEAQVLISQYQVFYADYQKKHADKEGPTVLILMGLPGSYVVATEKSYVGNLVKLAGGVNVYAESEDEFVNANTEDMLKRDPDIILRTAHAMPDQVMEEFAEEFSTNDIWQHFDAVKEGKVYDLNTSYFGMSATFDYQYALEDLDELFYIIGNF